jgi:hypothetical protein
VEDEFISGEVACRKEAVAHVRTHEADPDGGSISRRAAEER